MVRIMDYLINMIKKDCCLDSINSVLMFPICR